MEIEVLQGINLEFDHSVIKITTDDTPKTDHLDLLRKIHPVYMSEYTVNGKTITIHSDLIHIWKLIAPAINQFSSAEWSYELTKKYIFENVLNKHMKSMSSIPIFDSAQRLRCEITQYYVEEGFSSEQEFAKFNSYYVIGAGCEGEVFYNMSSSLDTYIGFQTQRDKWLTNTTIERLKLPIAKWSLIESEDHLKKIFNSYTLPVVIKPVGLTGGHGVVTKITSLSMALEAYKTAKKVINTKPRQKYQYKVMIQEQVTGEDYRLLVIDGELVIATKRIPAFVIGDGKRTIQELIEELNKDHRRDITNPTHTLKPITFDDMLTDYLTQQSLTIKSIPQKDEKIYVRKVASMSQGGVTEDFTEKVHPQIKAIVESLAKTNRCFVMGIDVICQNISEPLTTTNGCIIEMNTMPEAYLNAFPTIGKQYPNIGEIFIGKLLGRNRISNKIVTIGLQKQSIEQLVRDNVQDYGRIGIYSDGFIIIDNTVISTDIETWKAVEALKLNKGLDTIVFNYSTMKEAVKHGLGFNKIDLLIADHQALDKETEERLNGYANLGIISKLKLI